MITPQEQASLIAAAKAIQARAYAPYSNYCVGAALLADDGQLFTGVNVENASYGLTICAERNAIFAMVTAGIQRFKAIAIIGDGAVSPCGACRQVMVEFAGDVPVYLIQHGGEVVTTSLHQLLPLHFGPDNL